MLNYRTLAVHDDLRAQYDRAASERGLLVGSEELGLPPRRRKRRSEADPQSTFTAITVTGEELTKFFNTSALNAVRDNCPNQAFALMALWLATTAKDVNHFDTPISKRHITAALEHIRYEELEPKILEVLETRSLPENWETTVSEANKHKLHQHGVLLKSEEANAAFTANPLLWYTKSANNGSSADEHEGTGFGGDDLSEAAASETTAIQVVVVRAPGRSALYVQSNLRDSAGEIGVEEKEADPAWFEEAGEFPLVLSDVQMKGKDTLAA